MDRRFDPRSIVTPYAFAVHPDLLGRPLATPWQRLGAIMVDLVVIGLISQVGVAPLALGSAGLLVWLAFRNPGKEVFGKVFRFAVGCLGFLVLAITVLVIAWVKYGDSFQDLARDYGADIQINTPEISGPGDAEGSEGGQVNLLDIVQGIQGAAAIQGTETPEEAQEAMTEFARNAFDAGLSRVQTRELLEGVIPADAPWSSVAENLVDESIRSLTPADPGSPGGPTPEGEAGQDDAAVALSSIAMDSIDRLNREILSAQEDQADTEAALERTRLELEAEKNRGAFAWIRGLIEKLGLGSAWGALYLTIVHAWWKGTSVGKRVFRIRVVMIDKRPLNWWLSFERTGGYAAGFATGLLGFAQIFWDPNRQAIHDKVSETFVIQDGKDPLPGPWMEEGRNQWARGSGSVKEPSVR